MNDDPQGWAWPDNARKAHFFVEGESLCGGWMFFGAQVQTQDVGEQPGPDDCKACWRKATAMKETGELS